MRSHKWDAQEAQNNDLKFQEETRAPFLPKTIDLELILTDREILQTIIENQDEIIKSVLAHEKELEMLIKVTKSEIKQEIIFELNNEKLKNRRVFFKKFNKVLIIPIAGIIASFVIFPFPLSLGVSLSFAGFALSLIFGKRKKI